LIGPVTRRVEDGVGLIPRLFQNLVGVFLDEVAASSNRAIALLALVAQAVVCLFAFCGEVGGFDRPLNLTLIGSHKLSRSAPNEAR